MNEGQLSHYSKELLEQDLAQYGISALARNLGVTKGAIKFAMKRLECRTIQQINAGIFERKRVTEFTHPPLPMVDHSQWPDSAYMKWVFPPYHDSTLYSVYLANPKLVVESLADLRCDSDRYKKIKEFIDWVYQHDN